MTRLRRTAVSLSGSKAFSTLLLQCSKLRLPLFFPAAMEPSKLNTDTTGWRWEIKTSYNSVFVFIFTFFMSAILVFSLTIAPDIFI